MTALAARAGWAVRDVPATVTALVFVVWAAVAVAAYLHFAEIPRGGMIVAGLLVAGVVRLVFWPQPLPYAQQTIVLMACVVGAALPAASMIEGQARSLAAIAAAIGAGAFFRRRPTAAIVIAFAIGSSYASLQSNFEIDPYDLHDLVLAGLCAAVLMGYASARRTRRAVPLAAAFVFGAYVAVTRVYAEVAEVPVIGDRAFYVLAWYMLVLLAVAYGPWDRGTHTRIAKGLLVVATIVAGYAVLRWIIGPSDAEREFVLSDPQGAKYNIADGKLRLFGSFPNTRSLGVWTACVIPLCVALALHLRGRWRILAVAGAVLSFAALIGSGMRAGIGAAMLGCLFVILVMTYTASWRGVRLGVLGVAGIGLAMVVSILIAVSPDPTTSSRTYSTILNPTADPSYQARLYKWEQAWREADKYPFGQGLGTAGQPAVAYQRFATIGFYDVDNSYLKIVLDQGIFGLILFCSAMAALLITLVRRSLGTRDGQQAALGAAGAGALGAFLLAMWTGTYIEGMPAFTAWLITGLGLAQFATRARRPAAARAAE